MTVVPRDNCSGGSKVGEEVVVKIRKNRYTGKICALGKYVHV